MEFVTWDIRLIQLCIIISIFSQIDAVSLVFRPLMYLIWIITIAYYILNNVRHIIFQKFTRIYCLSYGMLVILCVMATMFGKNHLNGNYLHIMSIPLLVTFVGCFFGKDASSEDLQRILKTYLICAVAYAIWVNVTYYASYSDWLKQTMYVFVQKNSAAQIWAVGVLIAFLLIEYKSSIGNVLGYSAAIYLIIICGISQCRTALLALAIVACAYILLKSKHKLRWGILMVVACIFMWRLPFTRKFIDQALFLTKYAGADLNTFSSGRLGHWERAMGVFGDNLLFGVGQYYVDCSYLGVLAELGLTGFVLVELIWGSRVYINFKQNKGFIKDFLFCVTVFYLVESVLEGYPPFGPGVSSFMFWFLSAAFAGDVYNENWIINGKVE